MESNMIDNIYSYICYISISTLVSDHCLRVYLHRRFLTPAYEPYLILYF